LFAFSLIINYNESNSKLNYITDKNSFLYYKQSSGKLTSNISDITNYINNEKYDCLYNFNGLSYLISLHTNTKITKYDLINNGNMGYKGNIKIIKEVKNTCKKKKCLFIIQKDEHQGQTNKNIINYIKTNYSKKDEIDIFIIYSNY